MSVLVVLEGGEGGGGEMFRCGEEGGRGRTGLACSVKS